MTKGAARRAMMSWGIPVEASNAMSRSAKRSLIERSTSA